MNDLTRYMQTRRSALSLTLEEPGPDSEQIRDLVAIASRVPDHGKLAPWRFVHWTMPARQKMHGELLAVLEQAEDLEDKEKKRQGTGKLLHAPCVIVVVSKAAEHPKVPVWEQQLSAGAACMNLLVGANGLGFEAQWLTAWYVYYEKARGILQLEQGEQIAGIVHIGSCSAVKSERPRPELNDIFSIRES